MLFTRHLDGMKIRFGAARQHVRARPQGRYDCSHQPVPVGQARTHHRSLLGERTLDDLEDPFELDEQLGE